uniref:Uncharacterized protein n=1 Tax=Romanomermis culicivorax TaxID=13658 RepID=A0A915J0J1_ROMCU
MSQSSNSSKRNSRAQIPSIKPKQQSLSSTITLTPLPSKNTTSNACPCLTCEQLVTDDNTNAPQCDMCAEDNQDDLESVRQIVTDFGPELTENDTAITADDIGQRQRELVAQLNARKKSGETGLYIDFRHNCK